MLTLGDFQGDSLNDQMLIVLLFNFRLESHMEACDKVGFISPVDGLVGFKPANI